MKDSEVDIALLSVVLRPTEAAGISTPLIDWLPEAGHTPVWIGLSTRGGVTKVMPVFPQIQPYPMFLQSICQHLGHKTVVEWQGKPYEVTGVEVNNQALHVLNIPLTPRQPLPPTLGRAIHAKFFKWVAAADVTLAEQLHTMDNLPLTLAIRPTSSGQHLKLRISLLKKELLAPLLWGLSQDLGGDITLAGINCRLGKWIEIEQGSSFEELAQMPPQKVIELQFISPTSFKQQQDIQPFPLPALVFDSLWRRWNTFAPVELHFPSVQWQVLVSGFDLKTYALKMKGGAEIGAQGWVRYQFSDSEQSRIATVLANFAVFAGVGRKTAMGMGQTRFLSESWQRD